MVVCSLFVSSSSWQIQKWKNTAGISATSMYLLAKHWTGVQCNTVEVEFVVDFVTKCFWENFKSCEKEREDLVTLAAHIIHCAICCTRDVLSSDDDILEKLATMRIFRLHLQNYRFTILNMMCLRFISNIYDLIDIYFLYLNCLSMMG